MRYKAPPRESIAPEVFDHPVFAEYSAHRDLLLDPNWPTIETLNARLGERAHPFSGQPLRFVAQTPKLLADARHYECRTYETGAIATRADNWHDLLNALIWIEHTEIKAALNARQVADIAKVGVKVRTRGQCALTLFDEGGVIVLVRDAALLKLWDTHDWHGLFWRHQAAWSRDIELRIFGHALLEHALQPHSALTAKGFVVLLDSEQAAHQDNWHRRLVDGIAGAELLTETNELRPLPVSGIPGWHAQTELEEFYGSAPCFRPLPTGRRYPPPRLTR